MKIAILSSKEVFNKEQQRQLSEVGDIIYIDPPENYNPEYFKKLIEGAATVD